MLKTIGINTVDPTLEIVPPKFPIKSIIHKSVHFERFLGSKRVPHIKSFCFLCFPVFFLTSLHPKKISRRKWFCELMGVYVKVYPWKYFHPKTGKQSPQLSELKVFCKNIHFEEFWGSERVPLINPSWFLFFAGFSQTSSHPKKIPTGNWFDHIPFLDGVHVKMSTFRYHNPKTGNHSPRISLLKVFCKNVHFEEFWGSKRVPTPHKPFLILVFCRFFPNILTSKENL